MTTAIEWTKRVWNPMVGCKEKSAGCDRCYARAFAWRHMHNPKTQHKYAGTVRKLKNGHLQWTGRVNYDEDALSYPLSVKNSSLFFVDSMSDLWFENIPFEYITRVLAIMALTQDRPHYYQALTKRVDRALEYFRWLNNPDNHRNAKELIQKAAHPYMLDYSKFDFPLPNLMVIASVEDQEQAHIRIPDLISLKQEGHVAGIGLSVEPMLEEVDLSPWVAVNNPMLDWVICGAESGPGARPFKNQWATGLRYDCRIGKVPFFMKQIVERGRKLDYDQFPAHLQVREMPRMFEMFSEKTVAYD